MKTLYKTLTAIHELINEEQVLDEQGKRLSPSLLDRIYCEEFTYFERYIDRQEIKYSELLIHQDDEYVYLSSGLLISKYRKINREAKVGELIMITSKESLFGEDGLNEMHIVESVHEEYIAKAHVVVFRHAIYHGEYVVLEFEDRTVVEFK